MAISNVDWTHHVKDSFSLPASDEMRVLPVPGSTSCHQKNMNFSHSAIAGWDFCQDSRPWSFLNAIFPLESCLFPPTGKDNLPTIIFSCGPDVEKAKIIGALLQAPRGFTHIAKIGGWQPIVYDLKWLRVALDLSLFTYRRKTVPILKFCYECLESPIDTVLDLDSFSNLVTLILIRIFSTTVQVWSWPFRPFPSPHFCTKKTGQAKKNS